MVTLEFSLLGQLFMVMPRCCFIFNYEKNHCLPDSGNVVQTVIVAETEYLLALILERKYRVVTIELSCLFSFLVGFYFIIMDVVYLLLGQFFMDIIR